MSRQSDPSGPLLAPMGRATPIAPVTKTMTAVAIEANVMALVDALNKAKPSGAKGLYVRRVSLSSTMGPGFKIDTGAFPT